MLCVIGLFDSEFVIKGTLPRELSKIFHEVFELRQASDYRTFEEYTVDQINRILTRAQEFVDTLEAHIRKQSAAQPEPPSP